MKNHKRSKRSSKRLPRFWSLALGAFCLFSLFVGVVVHQELARERVSKKTWLFIGEILTIDAEKSRVVDRWWLSETPPADLGTFQLFESREQKILETLRRNRQISPLTAKISDRFTDFRLATVINGKIKHLVAEGFDTSLAADGIEICFVPEVAARRGLGYSLLWNTVANAIVIPAYDFPDKLFAAMVFHELGHALRHNQHDRGGRVIIDESRDRDIEEVEMHTLSADILDSLSGGEYYRSLDAILDRRLGTTNLTEALSLLTRADVEKFDAMFGCSGTEAPSKMLAANFTLLVGFRMVDRLGGGMEAKVSIYHAFDPPTSKQRFP